MIEDVIIFEHWPDDYPQIRLAQAKLEYRKLRYAYFKLIRTIDKLERKTDE